MTTISAEHADISIHDGFWELITEDETASQPAFVVQRGSGVMEYDASFGAARDLPGTVLSIEYVRAAVIGYDNKQNRWRLGLHILQRDQEKPRWLELVHWPASENTRHANAAQQAGRALAEHVGCPLKIFGAKKIPRPSAGRSGITGPLTPHKREDIGPEQVRLYAQSIKLPLRYPNLWLGFSRDHVTLRLAKDAYEKKRGRIAPAFNQCVIDPKAGQIRLSPPTGLLGSFFSGQRARTIPAGDVRNVELRHVAFQDASQREDEGGLLVDVTTTTHLWELYLTLPDESLMLAQTSHATTSDLVRQRPMGDKFNVDPRAGIDYLRLHEADQKAHDLAARWANSAGYVIASTLRVPLVKTEVEAAAI